MFLRLSLLRSRGLATAFWRLGEAAADAARSAGDKRSISDKIFSVMTAAVAPVRFFFLRC